MADTAQEPPEGKESEIINQLDVIRLLFLV